MGTVDADKQPQEKIMTTKRVFFGKKVLSAWDHKKFDLECPKDQTPKNFYSILCDADDPFYFDELEAHLVAEKFGGIVGD